jgi:hypothetical protein
MNLIMARGAFMTVLPSSVSELNRFSRHHATPAQDGPQANSPSTVEYRKVREGTAALTPEVPGVRLFQPPPLHENACRLLIKKRTADWHMGQRQKVDVDSIYLGGLPAEE